MRATLLLAGIVARRRFAINMGRAVGWTMDDGRWTMDDQEEQVTGFYDAGRPEREMSA